MKKETKVTKKVIKKVEKEEMLYVAGLISKGKDKGKYIAVQVRNTQLLNPVEPAFEANKGLEYMIVGKDEKIVRAAFAKLLMIK